MSTWAEIRAPLKVMLQAVTGINQVFEFPPSTLQRGDAPAYIIYPPGFDVQSRHTGKKTILYAVRLRLVEHDTDYADAASSIEDFATKLELKVDVNLKLGLGDIAIVGQLFEEGGSFEIGAERFAGQDCILTINANHGVAFATG